MATTHDAFHVHAPNADDLIEKFKNALEQLYKIDPLQGFLAMIKGEVSMSPNVDGEKPLNIEVRNFDLKQAKNMLT